MPLWGGLKPIRRRFVLDIAILSTFSYCIYVEPSTFHIYMLSLCTIITFLTSGITTRWTITFPMIPIILLQSLRYISTSASFTASRTHLFLQVLSFVFILKSTLLTILFPAVKINQPNGKYNVGVVDIHLPVENFEHDHATVRFLYPTLMKNSKVPYFDVETRDKICNLLMEHGAPPPLNKLAFLLNQWKLTTVNARRNAAPHVPTAGTQNDNAHDTKDKNTTEDSPSKLPIVVYSHGLTGAAEIYSYQAMSLASNGYFVMSITHSDKSAIGVKRKDGSFIAYDNEIVKMAGKKETYENSVEARRKQTAYRANELLAATDTLMKLNVENVKDLEELGLSFVGILDTNDVAAIGHSFGGATVIHASNLRPSNFKCCVAHDPACDWCPNETRQVLFSRDRFEDSAISYYGGTGGLPGYEKEEVATSEGIHDLDLYVLYSYEWFSRSWGHSNYLWDLFKRGKLGKKNGESEVNFVYKSHHSEFSDSCMKLPLWLARPVGVTGPRNPHDTAEEIFDRTLTFLEKVRESNQTKKKVE